MKILILETSSEKGCIVFNGRSEMLAGGPNLSKMLALSVKKILQDERPDRIAVGNGPGSHTGIRVGAALGKALAYAWQIPYGEFCSLKAFSSDLPVLVDARSVGIYALFPGEGPVTIQPSDLRLTAYPRFASPHPTLIQKKICFPLECIETSPDPALLLEENGQNRYNETHILNQLK